MMTCQLAVDRARRPSVRMTSRASLGTESPMSGLLSSTLSRTQWGVYSQEPLQRARTIPGGKAVPVSCRRRSLTSTHGALRARNHSGQMAVTVSLQTDQVGAPHFCSRLEMTSLRLKAAWQKTAAKAAGSGVARLFRERPLP